MGYLLPSDYVAYGLTADTQDAWVTAASSMIEAYCKRPTLMSASYTEFVRVSRHTQRVRLSYGPLISVQTVQAKYARPSRLFVDEQPFAPEFAEVFGASRPVGDGRSDDACRSMRRWASSGFRGT